MKRADLADLPETVGKVQSRLTPVRIYRLRQKGVHREYVSTSQKRGMK